MPRRLFPAFLAVCTWLTACDSGSTRTSEHATSIAEIESSLHVQPGGLSFQQVAEVLALGSRNTDLQRERLKDELVGSIVQWRLKVYEIRRDADTYVVTFQPVPLRSTEAISQVMAVAVVTPRGDEDLALISSAVTDSEITVKGRVQSVHFRSIVVLSPALLVHPPAETGNRS